LAGPSASSSNAPSSSSVQTVAALVVATVIGVGGGGFVGYTLVGEAPTAPSHGGETKEPLPAAAKSGGEAAEGGHGHGGSGHGGSGHGGSGHAAPAGGAKDAPAPMKTKLKELAPIVTNLAAPETSWVRLQAALVYDGEAAELPEILVSEVTADIVAFLRTMSLESIEGADGLRRLHEDLSERAMIRSEGKIRELIIQALVVQ
jgi:flagellar basal body-associated protein FliL